LAGLAENLTPFFRNSEHFFQRNQLRLLTRLFRRTRPGLKLNHLPTRTAAGVCLDRLPARAGTKAPQTQAHRSNIHRRRVKTADHAVAVAHP
jgi:hypothetical protein